MVTVNRLIGLGLIAVFVIFAVQNWALTVPLVVLGRTLPALPLAVWVFLALGSGAGTGLIMISLAESADGSRSSRWRSPPSPRRSAAADWTAEPQDRPRPSSWPSSPASASAASGSGATPSKRRDAARASGGDRATPGETWDRPWHRSAESWNSWESWANWQDTPRPAAPQPAQDEAAWDNWDEAAPWPTGGNARRYDDSTDADDRDWATPDPRDDHDPAADDGYWSEDDNEAEVIDVEAVAYPSAIPTYGDDYDSDRTAAWQAWRDRYGEDLDDNLEPEAEVDLDDWEEWDDWEDESPADRPEPPDTASNASIYEVQRPPVRQQQAGTIYSYSYRRDDQEAEEDRDHGLGDDAGDALGGTLNRARSPQDPSSQASDPPRVLIPPYPPSEPPNPSQE
jgi:hypothetical protein